MRDVASKCERYALALEFVAKKQTYHSLFLAHFSVSRSKTPKKRWFELKMLKFEPKLPYITIHYVGFTLVSSPTSSPSAGIAIQYHTIHYVR